MKPPAKAFKVKLILSYDGTDYGGWQRQKSGKATIQGTLEKALSRLFDEEIKLVGAGRTDAGVHARGQAAHFWVSKSLKRYNILQALYSLLPRNISVAVAQEVTHDFHAIGAAIEKTYKYSALTSLAPCALRSRWTYWYPKPVDLEWLQSLADPFVGTMDYKSFQSAGSEVTSTVRQIFQAQWQKVDSETLVFTVTGSGFLKQMVRNIVGTQLELLEKKRGPQEIVRILAARDRQQAGPPAPAQGLVLHQIRY